MTPKGVVMLDFKPNQAGDEARWQLATPVGLVPLLKDPKEPLLARAFRAEYPPASTFKAATALGILDSGKVDVRTMYDCNNALEIGNRVFHNWNKNGEGSMNVINAIKRSCNTWFYAAALDAGASATPPINERAIASTANFFICVVFIGSSVLLCLCENNERISR